MKERNLAGEFCVIEGEFSDLRCLMNTLIMVIYTLYMAVATSSPGLPSSEIQDGGHSFSLLGWEDPESWI